MLDSDGRSSKSAPRSRGTRAVRRLSKQEHVDTEYSEAHLLHAAMWVEACG